MDITLLLSLVAHVQTSSLLMRKSVMVWWYDVTYKTLVTLDHLLLMNINILYYFILTY
jgi:hypothetical protein